ncbi:unnamed protein product [Clonostachys rosea f. rosea IK726]|uniref:Uncharacterized protein n=1 Tax=Clonostachys rosea f. rosea IK726 TaxID=1349383 RepID=A0ACA9TS21_BIOOC|nr:unnamed protein product [Clonostachys rosea f. rosea IK726]
MLTLLAGIFISLWKNVSTYSHQKGTDYDSSPSNYKHQMLLRRLVGLGLPKPPICAGITSAAYCNMKGYIEKEVLYATAGWVRDDLMQRVADMNTEATPTWA